MRSIFTPILRLAPFFALTATHPLETALAQREESRGIEVLGYSPTTAYTKFSIPCPGCFNSRDAEADESLVPLLALILSTFVPQVFEIQISPFDNPKSTEVTVNDRSLVISWQEPVTESSGLFSIPDKAGTSHEVYVSGIGAVEAPPSALLVEDDVIQGIRFTVTPVQRVDDTVSSAMSFVALVRPKSPRRLVALISDSSSEMINLEEFERLSISGETAFGNGDNEVEESDGSESFDLGAELESVALLENQAQRLQTQIAAKKKTISKNLKQEREKLCLKHLIEECDGIVSTAKALAQRICDKVGIPTGPSLQYAHMRNQHAQHMVALDAKFQPQKSGVHNCPNGDMHCADSANIPLMLTKNATNYAFKPIDLVNPPNAVLRALQIVAAVLGIAALFAFLRKRCMSMRKRVERAADREERQNARAYRRAARRAMMRKRWDNFVNTVNCFRVKEEIRIEDYEEKRALILQDAFLEQDLDQAEKGEVMEAEIRELRYAHEIVSSLVQVDNHRYDLSTPVNDPPPPLVPLPYTPLARSRASTTYTLPSYTSESLPDYSSRPGDVESSSSVTNGFTPSISDEEGRVSLVSPISETSSGRTRYTPTSSIPDSEPRPSQETIRTRPSRDTEYR